MKIIKMYKKWKSMKFVGSPQKTRSQPGIGPGSIRATGWTLGVVPGFQRSMLEIHENQIQEEITQIREIHQNHEHL